MPGPGSEPANIAALHAATGAKILQKFENLDNLQVVELPRGLSVRAAIDRYQRSGLFEFVEPDYRVSSSTTPNDPRFQNGTLWALNNTGQSGGTDDADIDAPEAWSTLHSAESVIVAVVDSGIRYTHEDLAGNLWTNPGEIAGNGKDDDGNRIVDDVHGMNAIDDSGDPLDDNGHGTHVAGTIGGIGDNGKGVVGVAWTVQIMALKFMDSGGSGYVSDAIQCIDYARAHGANVINASWGGPDFSLSLQSAIDKLRQDGIIFVAAAGNDSTDNDNQPTYPACFDLDNIITVAASTRTDALADYSNYGANSVDLAAPGSSIYSCWNQGDSSYAYSSGTSMATPHVTGAMALLKARFPDLSYRELIARLLDHVDPVSSFAGKCVTGGRLNLEKALGSAVEAAFSATPETGTFPLDVQFSDESFGAITEWIWDFGDGTPESNEPSPTHTFAYEGNFPVTLTVRDAAGNSDTATRTISAVSNYQIEPSAYDWIDSSGLEAIVLGDDEVSGVISLPFGFQFYGTRYDRIYISSNGLLGFDPAGLSESSNSDIPGVASPNSAIYPYWDDLNPQKSGAIYAGVVGNAPDRKYVISWVNVALGAPGKPIQFTFQAVLEETTNRIYFQYQEVNSGDSRGGGGSATIGVENTAGNVAARYSYNNSVLSNGDALVFIPTVSTSMAVTANSELSFAGEIGGEILPAEHTLEVKNSGNTSLAWSAVSDRDWLTIVPDAGNLDIGQSTVVAVQPNELAAAMEAGVYTATVQLINEVNGIGNAEYSVRLEIQGTTGILTVTPEGEFTSEGVEGGPFSPLSHVYTLVNTGDASLNWEARQQQSWLDLSQASGSLSVGESVTVTATINTNALALPAGQYTDAIEFLNLTNGEGDTTRPVTLTANQAPALLEVSPQLAQTIQGVQGGPFDPSTIAFSLSNPGATEISWSLAGLENWLDASASEGVISPGGAVEVSVSVNQNAAALPAGNYAASLQWIDANQPDTPLIREVSLQVDPLPGVLALDSNEDFVVNLLEDGTLSPPSKSYLLSNAGESSIDWELSASAAWLNASPAGGALAPGETQELLISVNDTAGDLAAGDYSAEVLIGEAGQTESALRIAVALTIEQPVQVNISDSAETGFMLALAGTPGAVYAVETSSDLKNWTPLTTLIIGSDGLVQFSDPEAGLAQTKFYRVFRITSN